MRSKIIKRIIPQEKQKALHFKQSLMNVYNLLMLYSEITSGIHYIIYHMGRASVKSDARSVLRSRYWRSCYSHFVPKSQRGLLL